MAERVFIGLGSNLAEPARQVRDALRDLGALPDTRLVRQSSLYASPPMGPPDQPDYINAVAELRTELAPLALLAQLQGLERRSGRERVVRWGPRTLDLDILLWGERKLALEGLTVPHPGVHERAFVLYPLAEIAPGLSVPGRGELGALLAQCERGGLRRLEPGHPAV
ncbi:2-amino-4-hydroxy-6-hydroxymethyldihydropteridine diphosphokinase [Alkalilimnicola sp. S0819]|uniref:2-amino-4-hydroxy-6- hydroxymethyldihydropteridine diphosphokinase n=1 Tax=Alkalilimnicola sp. S0819 TaxID=2613922 RepID=UPI00186A4974|nr:2-amino-4-hydroxy-6-hydroxymethyldihydropteridine diphosphokinase [Alkalilimnicola sp. S0819]